MFSHIKQGKKETWRKQSEVGELKGVPLWSYQRRWATAMSPVSGGLRWRESDMRLNTIYSHSRLHPLLLQQGKGSLYHTLVPPFTIPLPPIISKSNEIFNYSDNISYGLWGISHPYGLNHILPFMILIALPGEMSWRAGSPPSSNYDIYVCRRGGDAGETLRVARGHGKYAITVPSCPSPGSSNSYRITATPTYPCPPASL